MKRYLTIFSISALLGISTAVRAQDLHFSQFYDNAVLRNPALTGIFTGDYKVGLDYRSQWGSLGVPYTTTMLSGETRILTNRDAGDYLSLGLVGTYDKAGTISFASEQIYAAIAYNKALEDQHHTYLSVGLTGGFLNRSVDQSKMTLTSQYILGVGYDASNPTFETGTYKSLNNYDVGAGVSLNSSLDQQSRANYYLGASLYHINRPTEIFNGGNVLVKLPMKFQFNAGFHIPFSEQFGITIHANYSLQQPYQEILAGGMFTWRSMPIGMPSIFAFSFGAFYRVNDAIIPTIKIDYKNLAIGFSYDVNNSSLATGASGAGATEITLYIKGEYKHDKNPRDPLMCPRFEDIIYH